MTAPERLHFHPDYREEITLEDGTPVVLRQVRVGDRDLIKKGFERLSPESRYLRFFTGKNSLSNKELAYLSAVDGMDHFALGVIRMGEDGTAEGLGVGRFIRLEPGGDIAEPAITVLDECQGKGLGTLLLHRLCAAARERGVKRFYTEFLSNNERIRHMLNQIAPAATIREEGGVVYAEFPVPATAPDEHPSEVDRESILHQLLSSHAAGDLLIRIQRSLLKWHE